MSQTQSHYVSLADILANGVAIILILIVLSLAIQQYNQEQELTQVRQVGAVMSREMGRQAITNPLPSSRPAVLHHYDHKRFNDAPLLILHDDYLLIKDNGAKKAKTLNWKITRHELLLKNNRFDLFLNSLSTQQKKRIRLDIIDISLYYLVLSIIKTHQLTIRHWHFEVDKGGANHGANDIEAPNDAISANKESNPDSNNEPLWLAPIALENNPNKKASLPIGSDFSTLKNSTLNPNNKQLPASKQTNNQLPPLENWQQSVERLEIMKQLFAQQKGISKGQLKQQFLEDLSLTFGEEKITIKDVIEKQRNQKKTQKKEKDKKQNTQQEKYIFDLNSAHAIEKQLLNTILNYLTTVQNAYQKHRFVNPTFSHFLSSAVATENAIYKSDIENIYQYHKSHSFRDDHKKTITTQLHISDKTSLITPLNSNITELILETTVTPTFLKDSNYFDFNLYPLPTVDKAKQITLTKNDIILLPHQLNIKEKQWFVIAITNAKLDNIQFGFVYGNLLDKQLKLSNNINDLTINYQHIEDTVASNKKRHQLLQWLWYLLIASIVIVFLIKNR